MANQIPLSSNARAPETREDEAVHEIAPDLAYRRTGIVNVVFFGPEGAGDRNWVLIDTGLIGAHGAIVKAAASRFGENARPAAVVLTHGHFDHVGSVKQLAEDWDVPVYAHPAEHPYLNGSAAYPPPDPSVGGGLLARLSPLFPSGPIDLGERLRSLPEDGSVPNMPGWRWIHAPGHAPGQVCLWNSVTRTLIAADAIVTTGQESAYEAAVQEPEMHGPPMYFTPDWVSAHRSVESLAALEPELVITGHGRAMAGAEMRAALHQLAREFQSIAVPRTGHYVDHPATAANGTAYRHP